MAACETVGPLMAGALDGELTDAERQQLDAHLIGCALCREEMAVAQATVLRLEGLSAEAAERDLWPGVAAALGSGRERISLWWVVAAAAAAVGARLIDLVWLGGATWSLRFVALALVIAVFAAIRANPLRLVGEAQLTAMERFS